MTRKGLQILSVLMLGILPALLVDQLKIYCVPGVAFSFDLDYG